MLVGFKETGSETLFGFVMFKIATSSVLLIHQ